MSLLELSVPEADRRIELLEQRLLTLETIISLVPDPKRNLARCGGVISIVMIAAELWDVSTRDILGPLRSPVFVEPRMAVSWVTRQTLPYSLPMIGRAIGGRDHTTVLHHLRQADRRRARDAMFRERTDRMVVAVEAAQRALVDAETADA